jgi:hypothetical protein
MMSKGPIIVQNGSFHLLYLLELSNIGLIF